MSAAPPLEEPIRAELFGIERLEHHAESLAAAQPVMHASTKGRRLLARVQDNGRVLRDAYRVIARTIREERTITPAAEAVRSSRTLSRPTSTPNPRTSGEGGWTWYTGSAGWMSRAGLESILGFRLRGTRLVIDPCIPRDWPGFTVAFRHRSARYTIVVENPHGVGRGVASVVVDGVAVGSPACIPLPTTRTAT